MNSHNEEVNKQSAVPWKDQFFDPKMTRALSGGMWLAAAARADVLQRNAPQLDASQLDSPLSNEQKDAVTARAFLKAMFDADGNYRGDIVAMSNEVDNPRGGDSTA